MTVYYIHNIITGQMMRHEDGSMIKEIDRGLIEEHLARIKRTHPHAGDIEIFEIKPCERIDVRVSSPREDVRVLN